MTITRSFELSLMRELTRIRNEYSKHNMHHMDLTISASGRVDADELRITFRVDSNYSSNSVEGSNIGACLEEFFRRNNWKKAHDYLALPNVPEIK
jgi:hypothetical protein